jgi:hypothetical protein
MANNQFAMALSQINRILTRKPKEKRTYIHCLFNVILPIYNVLIYSIFVVKMSTLKMSLYGDFLSSTIKIRLSHQFLLPQ